MHGEYDPNRRYDGPVSIAQLASQIYRDYDGNKSTFGDTSVSTSVVNPDNLSSFGAVLARWVTNGGLNLDWVSLE